MTKILLVEDDKSLREIYGVRLLAEGYDIVSAGDGEEALAMAIKERPALIVSDVMMPKISGFDMLDILRSTTETKDIKVIMMTALSSEDQRQRGEKLGADRYLVKSQVGIEDVVRTVHEVLGDLPGMTPSPTAQPAAPAPAASPAPMPQPTAEPPQPVQESQTVPQPPVTPSLPPLSAQPTVTQTQSALEEAARPDIAALSPQQSRPNPLPQPGSNPLTASAPAPAESISLPQPTAPFSSSAPRPSNLGDRVIQPLQSADNPAADVAKLIEQELNAAAQPMAMTPSPTAQSAAPAPATSPAPMPQPTTEPPQPVQEPQPVPPVPPMPMPQNLPPQPVATPTPEQYPTPTPPEQPPQTQL